MRVLSLKYRLSNVRLRFEDMRQLVLWTWRLSHKALRVNLKFVTEQLRLYPRTYCRLGLPVTDSPTLENTKLKLDLRRRRLDIRIQTSRHPKMPVTPISIWLPKAVSTVS